MKSFTPSNDKSHNSLLFKAFHLFPDKLLRESIMIKKLILILLLLSLSLGVSARNKFSLSKIADYSIDQAKCTNGQKSEPGSTKKFRSGQRYDFYSEKSRNKLTKYFEKQTLRFNSHNTQKSIGQRDLLKEYIKIIDTVKNGLKEYTLRYNELAQLDYKEAYTYATQEAELDKKLFQECGASLTTDSLNSMEHVRYFYPRQVSDGSAKTFQDKSLIKNIEDSLQKLVDASSFQEARNYFEELKKPLTKLGAYNSLINNRPRDNKGFLIENRLRTFWACSIGSSAAFTYYAWARKSQKIGEDSKEQLKNKKEILSQAKNLRKLSCQGVEEAKLSPQTTAREVCDNWIKDTLFFSETCHQTSTKKTDYFQEIIKQTRNAKRSVNAQVEMTPFGRTFKIHDALKSTQNRQSDIIKTIKELEKRKADQEQILESLEKISFIKKLSRKIKDIFSPYIKPSELLISPVYADIREGMTLIGQKRLEKNKTTINRKFHEAKLMQAKRYPSGLTHLNNLYQVYSTGIKQMAFSNLKKKGISISSYKGSPTKVSFDKIPSFIKSDNIQNSKNPISNFDSGPIDDNLNNSPNISKEHNSFDHTSKKYKVRAIHKDKNRSLFNIISSRYMKKQLPMK